MLFNVYICGDIVFISVLATSLLLDEWNSPGAIPLSHSEDSDAGVASSYLSQSPV